LEDAEFIKIIDGHKDLIFKICYSYCRDSESRKDLGQEILINLWRSFKKYNGTVKLSTWIYTVGLNTAISFYRKGVRRKESTSLLEAIISIPDEKETLMQERLAWLYDYIGRLKELDKALLLLYLDDKSYKEIAEIIGITEAHVGTKLNRIKKSLKANSSTFKI
jgi:RNA polymerase sigma-70 factor (ECF subfamily)